MNIVIDRSTCTVLVGANRIDFFEHVHTFKFACEIIHTRYLVRCYGHVDKNKDTVVQSIVLV